MNIFPRIGADITVHRGHCKHQEPESRGIADTSHMFSVIPRAEILDAQTIPHMYKPAFLASTAASAESILQLIEPYSGGAMHVVSVNVGLPREVEWKNMTVQTGIFKEPVSGPVAVGRLNLAGDRQADLTVHGGAEKAIYGYPSEHYSFWREQLPDTPLSPAQFGENLTTEGLSEDSLYIGDVMRVGSALLMVTQPRMPCYKLALRFGRDDIIKRFLESRRSGFYFSVIEEGELEAGSEIEVLDRNPSRVTVTDIVDLYHRPMDNPELLQRALSTEALPLSWRDYLRKRADAIQQRGTTPAH